MTSELVERIVTVFATFPTWSQERVYHHVRQQGVAVTQAQVRQAAEQSGWLRLHQTLTEQYTVDEHGLRFTRRMAGGATDGAGAGLVDTAGSEPSVAPGAAFSHQRSADADHSRWRPAVNAAQSAALAAAARTVGFRPVANP